MKTVEDTIELLNIADLSLHPACDTVPRMRPDEWEAFLADVLRRGVHEPIVVQAKSMKILDGRHRFEAEKIRDGATISARIVDLSEQEQVDFIVRSALLRRHLSETQRSMLGGKLMPKYEEAAKERQRKGGGDKKSGVENLPHPIENQGKARDKAAKAVGVSGKSVDYAKRVLKNGVPELIKAVEEDKIAVSTAAKIAAKEPEEQKRILSSTAGRPTARVNTPSEPEPKEGEVRGVGVIKANEAINCLIRIPKDDPLRKRGFQIVTDWIRSNK